MCALAQVITSSSASSARASPSWDVSSIATRASLPTPRRPMLRCVDDWRITPAAGFDLVEEASYVAACRKHSVRSTRRQRARPDLREDSRATRLRPPLRDDKR